MASVLLSDIVIEPGFISSPKNCRGIVMTDALPFSCLDLYWKTVCNWKGFSTIALVSLGALDLNQCSVLTLLVWAMLISN